VVHHCQRLSDRGGLSLTGLRIRRWSTIRRWPNSYSVFALACTPSGRSAAAGQPSWLPKQAAKCVPSTSRRIRCARVARSTCDLEAFCRNQLGGQGGRAHQQAACPSAQTVCCRACGVADTDGMGYSSRCDAPRMGVMPTASHAGGRHRASVPAFRAHATAWPRAVCGASGSTAASKGRSRQSSAEDHRRRLSRWGCGKAGPPSQPEKAPPARPLHLRHWQGDHPRARGGRPRPDHRPRCGCGRNRRLRCPWRQPTRDHRCAGPGKVGSGTGHDAPAPLRPKELRRMLLLYYVKDRHTSR
jgi:hypothetical protein